jgi:hypothetical protein
MAIKRKPMAEHEIQLLAAKDEYLTLFGFCLAGMGLVVGLLLAQLILPWATVVLLLLAAGVIFSVRKLRQTTPEYTLTPQGIRFGPTLGRDWIPWTDITAISTERNCDKPAYVQLELKRDATCWTTLSPVRRQFLRVYTGNRDWSPVARLYTAGLQQSHEQVLQTVQRYWLHHAWHQQKEAA